MTSADQRELDSAFNDQVPVVLGAERTDANAVRIETADSVVYIAPVDPYGDLSVTRYVK